MDAIATKLATGGRADEWESEGDGFVEDFAYGKPIGFALPNVEQVWRARRAEAQAS